MRETKKLSNKITATVIYLLPFHSPFFSALFIRSLCESESDFFQELVSRIFLIRYDAYSKQKAKSSFASNCSAILIRSQTESTETKFEEITKLSH